MLGGVDAASGAALTPLDGIGAAEPLAPIVHDGCIFNVATSPPTFTRMCNGVVDQTEPLTGADPSALRLRLVNGWVWINDLTSGTLWIAGTDTELERIDDWGSTLGSEGDEPDDNPGDQEEGDTEENPDIGEIRDPEIDEDGVNEPPVARDDVARTRADQPVVVDLLANDEDPDGDALMVASLDGVPDRGGGRRHARPALRAGRAAAGVHRQHPVLLHGQRRPWGIGVGERRRGGRQQRRVEPAADRPDRHRRGPRRGVGGVQRAQQRQRSRRRHVRAQRRPGPERPGDLRPVGRDQLHARARAARPARSSSSTRSSTSFGATANGTVRVAIRLDTSNNEPRAVNDSASTVVGMPVTLNVLKNDADPDNDPLTVAGLPQLVSSTGNPNALEEISLLDDGEFFFLPTVAGDYVFLYAIIDGSERDAAYIRIRRRRADREPATDGDP